jgi:hypothetical protein
MKHIILSMKIIYVVIGFAVVCEAFYATYISWALWTITPISPKYMIFYSLLTAILASGYIWGLVRVFRKKAVLNTGAFDE